VLQSTHKPTGNCAHALLLRTTLGSGILVAAHRVVEPT